jgi:hypothetical protein
MELAFKASLLTRFRGGWDRTRATHFQGKCQVHCTSSATIYQKRVSSMNRKRDMNKCFVSLQARHVHAREFFHFIPYIPTLPPCDIKSKESEM